MLLHCLSVLQPTRTDLGCQSDDEQNGEDDHRPAADDEEAAEIGAEEASFS